MNEGHDPLVEYQSTSKNRSDKFSGVCPCGPIDVAYIDANRDKLCLGN